MKAFHGLATALVVALQMASCLAVEELPPCGLTCIVEMTSNSTCALTDTACICRSSELANRITTCVAANCSIREQLTTEKFSKDTCGVVPRDRTKTIAAVGVTFNALAVLVFCFRVMSKLNGSGGTFGMDDCIMAFVVALLIPFGALSILLAKHGLGRDIWNVSFEDIQYIAYIYFWGELTYLCALPLTKISILCFYLRIFPRREFKYFVWALMAANIGYLIAFELVSIFQCKPVNAAWRNWDKEDPSKCNNINMQGWMSAAINIVLDVGTLILPMPELYKLSMSPKKKFQLMLMFGVGFFVTIVSILRLKTLIQFANTTNLTQDYVDLSVWSNIELPVGVICACMPSIRTLLRGILPSVFSSTSKGETSASSSMPKLGRLSQTPKSGRHASKPSNLGNDSFVQLVEMDSRNGSNAIKV